MPQGYDLLAVTRVARIMQTLAEEIEIPNTLRFLARRPLVNAVDGEIFGTFESRVVSADIIADDQSAVVRQGGRMVLQTSAIPNLKQGSLVTQAMLNLLNRINQGGGIPADRGIFTQYLQREMQTKLASIRVLMNRMLVGMELDSFAYKKLGIVYSGITWGMPSDLKFVPATAWTVANAATSTPIQDLQLYLKNAQLTYGEVYNRITMSTTVFNNIVVSTDFRNHAQLFTAAANAAGTFPVNVPAVMRPLFEQVTGLQLELEDATWNDENNDGTLTTGRYLPENQCILSNTADDNNAAVMDFANAIVNETEVGQVPGAQVIGGGFPAPQNGPVGYATIRGDLNPPNLTLWAVARGFPRKMRATATARITAYP